MTTTLEVLIIASLASWRVARMIALEEGPFSVFAWLRGHVDPNQRGWIGRGLNCVACVSLWVALVISIALQLSVIDWLAIAGGAVILHRLIG